MQQQPFTHLDAQGAAHMVDISEKPISTRQATAVGFIHLQPTTLALLLNQALPKGDVLATARIAGIQAAKRTSDLIPLCHPLALSKLEVDLTADTQRNQIRIETLCKLNGKTGVEMEALTAASVAALTIYDMCKAVDRSMTIQAVRLLEKHGGKSGSFVAPQ